MNVGKLIERFFSENSQNPVIEVFDNKNIYDVYTDIVNMLSSYPDIELSVLQGLSYCFYEVLDNVLTHSEKECGTVLMRYVKSQNLIQLLVADDGVGIKKSLSQNIKYSNITESEAVKLCIEDNVTDGKGMGFGLYSTSRLVKNAGIKLLIHSGKSILLYEKDKVKMQEAPQWRGSIIYFEIHSDREINPNDIVEYRTDCETQFNETFFDTNDMDNLW